MNIQFKVSKNHQDWKRVRKEVFMEEQGFKSEFDLKDYSALHLTIYVDEKLAGTCRSLIEDNVGIIGRLAVLPEYRAKGHGKRLLQKMEELLLSYNVRKMRLSAQSQAVPFYESQGYVKVGEPVYDEHVIHQMMEKEVKEKDRNE